VNRCEKTLSVTSGGLPSRGSLAPRFPAAGAFSEWTGRAGWSADWLVRVVPEQDRYALNQGNIVGQELGPTAGFTVVSLNGGWRSGSGIEVTAGIDNLLDRAYAEHLSRFEAMVAGYEQATRVNEPGRTL
jgi:iron complex outermembrane receptor protein